MSLIFSSRGTGLCQLNGRFVLDVFAHPRRSPIVFKQRRDGSTGQTSFKYLIDASGRAGVLSVKYFKDRVYNPEFKNVAFWTYWKGSGEYKPGTPRAGSPFFEALHGKPSFLAH